MKTLDEKQKKGVKRMFNILENGQLGIIKELNGLDYKIDQSIETLSIEINERIDSLELQKGDTGEKGKDGENYVLTEEDKQEIAESIEVPVVEKVIVKETKVIKEKPIIKEITKVTNEIKEVAIPEKAEAIRDKLENMKNKLSINAIDELPEMLEELSKDIKEMATVKSTGRAQGWSKLVRFIDDFTPIGTIDGANATFKISKTPHTGSLKVYRGGARQRVTEDYTFDGYRTITFINAPQVGEVLLADFRY